MRTSAEQGLPEDISSITEVQLTKVGTSAADRGDVSRTCNINAAIKACSSRLVKESVIDARCFSTTVSGIQRKVQTSPYFATFYPRSS